MLKAIFRNKRKIVIVLLVVLALSYSDALAWGHRDGRYYYHGGRWYRPAWFGFDVAVSALTVGVIIRALPVGYTTVVVAGRPYYYYDNVYFRTCPSGYIVVPAPAEMPVVLVAPTGPQAPTGETVTINVPNSTGGYTPVTLVKYKDGYLGPQGEYYRGNPTVNQLKALYGK